MIKAENISVLLPICPRPDPCPPCPPCPPAKKINKARHFFFMHMNTRNKPKGDCNDGC